MSPSMLLRRAVADGEFRDKVLGDPEPFGISASTLPGAVEQPDQESLESWTESVAAIDAYQCQSTCSVGPITVVCDGTTK